MGGTQVADTAKTLLTGGHEGEVVLDPTDRLAKVCTPTDSARILNGIVSRVSKLEIENFPSDINSLEAQGVNRLASVELPHMDLARVEEHAKPLQPVVGPGGAFARLVIIKELQPVPEHAPMEVRHLLELALDHHQVRGWNEVPCRRFPSSGKQNNTVNSWSA